jgi:hypothetical protein
MRFRTRPNQFTAIVVHPSGDDSATCLDVHGLPYSADEEKVVVLPEGVEFPMDAVGRSPNGRCFQIYIERSGDRIVCQIGPEMEP